MITRIGRLLDHENYHGPELTEALKSARDLLARAEKARGEAGSLAPPEADVKF